MVRFCYDTLQHYSIASATQPGIRESRRMKLVFFLLVSFTRRPHGRIPAYVQCFELRTTSSAQPLSPLISWKLTMKRTSSLSTSLVGLGAVLS